MKTDVAIIGGGVTGLSAAWRLQQQGIAYALIECDSRWGGKVHTERPVLDGETPFILDAGADSFVTRKAEVWELAHELGLAREIIPLASQARGVHILHEERLYPVPLTPAAFITSRLLSPAGKLRLLAEPFIPARRDDGDESLAAFARRRLGRQASERLIEPILGGIYNSDPEQQSVLVSAPHMRTLEAEHGSLIRGSLAAAQRKRGQPRRPAFIAFAYGADRLVTALAERLTGQLILGSGVVRLEQGSAGFHLHLEGGQTVQARAVILATLANTAAALLHNLAPQSHVHLSSIRHTSIGTALMAFADADWPPQARISSVMAPRRAGRALDAVVVVSRRIPQRAPVGYTLLKVFFGGARPQLFAYEDEVLLDALRTELRALMGIAAMPVLSRVFRWPDSYPMAVVGHRTTVERARAALPPGLFLAGSSYEGVGVPDCIRQGQSAAVAAAHFVAGIVSTQGG